MNKNDLKIFKEIETNLNTAYYSDYSRNVPQYKLEQAKVVYENETGVNLGYINYSCATCVLNLLKRIGKWYFNEINKEQ